MKLRQILILTLVFLDTVLVRNHRLSETFIFGEDQEDLSWRVKQIIIDRQPTLISAKFSSLGFYLPPGYLYLLAPFFLVTNFHPVTGQLVIIALAGITGILLYLTGGWLAWYIYLTSPLLHQYDRIFWNPNLILPASALAVLALTKKRPLLAAVAAGLALQSHPQAIWLTLVIFFYYRRHWPIILGIISLLVSPLILVELRHGLPIPHHLLSAQP